MINIFISRPTWIAKEFKEGLSAFLKFLDSHDIKPRTLGSTDYPTEPPLDEVIKIMDDCKGAIILGYPQIYVTKGTIKGEENTNFYLPSEWNHIEATLAYIKKLPLLIIHHKGIPRGIFEHGAIGKFIYEKDLSKLNWFLEDDIIGALNNWKTSIKEPQIKKTIVLKPAPKPVPIPMTTPITKPPPSQERLGKDVESVLIFLFNQESYHYRDLSSIKDKFHCNSAAAQYYIDVFLNRKMIEVEGQWSSGGYYYSLTAKGREYVMTNKLISI